MIDREFLHRAFDRYISSFDASDERIALKIRHTAFVAENSDRIAGTLSLSEDDRDLAWAIAMLHDIGRFEQAAANSSFIDSVSSDHAVAGVKYLFEDGGIRLFIPDGILSAEDLDEIRLAIAWHNRHAVPAELSDRSRLFCNIIRDADKLDIFRVCVENTFEVAHEYPPETVADSQISPEVIDCFEKFETLDYSKRRFPADIFLGHIAMCFGLFFRESRKIAAEQGYILHMADFSFTDPRSQKQYERMQERLNEFLSQDLG